MNEVLKEPDFKWIQKAVAAEAEKKPELKPLLVRILTCVMSSNPDDVIKRTYDVQGAEWTVYHGPTFKMTMDSEHTYHCFFDKLTGFNLRFGKTLDEDPEYCALGPEIADIEVVTDGCVPVPGSTNCKYCYKGNTNAKPTNMTLDTFKQIVRTFPINLSQIAFGITGLKANPDLPKMFEHCREIGIVPNVTTVGADMDDKMCDCLCKWCGAVAVSCYTGAKQLCYDTIKRLHDHAEKAYHRDLHVNMHIVVSKDNMPHVRDVLKDIADKKVEGLKSVVLLRIKPKGRAARMDCVVPKSMYEELVSFCLEHDISFGFDSCSATPVMDVLKKLGHEEMCSCCESCESSKFSSYINVHGQYWSCSFAEGTSFIKPVDTLAYKSSLEWWNGEQVRKARFCEHPACRSCPVYKLDD